MVSYFYPPMPGGLPAQTHFLARSLVARGVAVQAVTVRTSGAPARELVDGVAVSRLPTLPMGGYRTRAHPWLGPLAAFLWIHRHEYDLLHVHQALHPAALCVAVGKALGKPVLVKVTGSGAPGNVQILRTWGGTAPLVRRLLHQADAVVSLSGEITAELEGDGYDKTRIVRIPNGVDFAAHAEDDARAASHPPLVLTCTRLSPEKANDVLLHAWPSVVNRFPQARLRILGDGPARESLVSLANDLGIASSVQWCGQVADVPRHLAQADVFVLPSRSGEGMSNALLEAMAAGCACVASDITANREVLGDGELGRLFRSENPAELAARIEALLADDSQRRRLGESARRAAQDHYAMSRVAARYEELYRALVARTRPLEL